MHVTSRARHVLSALAASALVCDAGVAVAGKQECAQSYVEAQKLMRSGALRKAREKLMACGAEDCLLAVKKDCVAWLGEVNTNMPSLVIVAKAPDGEETQDVRVYVDEELAAQKLDAKGLEVDPGTHKLRFELEGSKSVTKEVLLRQGQKNKVIEVRFTWDGPISTSAPASSGKPPTAEADSAVTTKSRGGPPVATYILGGAGLVAAGAGAFFWLSAESKKKDLEDSHCAPNCSPDDVDAVRTNRIVGDVLMGVGVVSIGIAVVLWVTSGKPESPKSAAGLKFDFTGTSMAASARF